MMDVQMKEKIKIGVWSAIGGAIVVLIVIFAAGWVVTSGSAEAKTEEMVEKAIIDHLAPIAVAQFLKHPNKEEQLKDLKKLDSWKRDDYVIERGWVTMPGSKSPNREIADEVVDRLMELAK